MGVRAATDSTGTESACGTLGGAIGEALQRHVWKNPRVQSPAAQESLQLSTS